MWSNECDFWIPLALCCFLLRLPQWICVLVARHCARVCVWGRRHVPAVPRGMPVPWRRALLVRWVGWIAPCTSHLIAMGHLRNGWLGMALSAPRLCASFRKLDFVCYWSLILPVPKLTRQVLEWLVEGCPFCCRRVVSACACACVCFVVPL